MTETRTASVAELGFDPARLARLDKHLARYVDDGRLSGWQLLLTKNDQIAHESAYGWRDREAGQPVESDTLWRIASMTKPITSVAAMTLWEEGAFELTDPISRWLPAFADARVYVKGVDRTMVTVPATEPIRVWHLLSHTSGLTAGFMRTGVVDELYRRAGYEFGSPPHPSIAECVDDWAGLPLLFQPGSAWGYGVSHDLLGRLIELWSGHPLDVAVRNRVLQPLGMTDTVWHCDEARRGRLAALYVPDADEQAVRSEFSDAVLHRPAILSGGGGLLSTAGDYSRFARMLANQGQLDGTRILSPRTVRLMTRNHLPGDLAALSTGGFAETSLEGVGFGLGFAVMDDPRKAHSVASRGEFYWGGIASTGFWVDPVDDLTCVFMTQLMPSSSHPIRSQLRQLVYSARTD
ncbi:MAG: beta-lactamase family protein [Actinomycetota bacterium]|nr:beta-lactamase family protein [Actinomycetota bacterium]